MTTTDLHLCLLPGERLDKYLADLRQDLTRSQIQKLIQSGHVLLNGQAARSSTRLRTGDQIRVHVPEPPPQQLVPEDIPLKMVYEDDHVLVVDKPPGLTVHPAPGHPKGTLVNALIARYPELQVVGGKGRPGIVHRLDADTSGLMVVARTSLAYLSLSRQIRDRTITKEYLALVAGHPQPTEGTVEAPIARHPVDRQRMGVVARGRQASTYYCTLRRFKGFALLKVRPYTGRTHQIRVHLSAIGHPVAGDAKYGARVPFLKRQFLHAQRLGFLLPPSQAYVEFNSPLPPDLDQALQALDPIP